MNETPSSPIAPKSIETPVYTPSQTQQIEREPSDDTPALDTQRETQTSTDETTPKTNQGEGKPDDEIVIESPAAQTQVLQKETLEMNETPSSPISPKSIEAQVFTPIQKQQTVTEETYEATQPLTEIISANNKKEDTHAVHYRPSSPLSSLIALVIEENKNALSETETATQYFSTSEGEHSQSSRKNQEEEYLKDTTEATTELVSTDVSKTQPLTPQTQHLQTSEGDQSDETPSEQNQAEENLKDTTEPTTELVSTDVSKMPPITQQTEHLQTSAIDFSETNEVEVSRLLAHFQIGAEVEILSTDDEIWYPGKVVDLKLCEGLEELTVEYTTLFTDQHRLQKLQDTITADKIRPATPTSDQKSFEMMDKVEAFYNNGWSSGQISMVLGDNTYSVCLYTSMETILFKHSDLRIHREWKDGVWKMADKVKPDKKRKAAASSQNSGLDNVFLRRSERVPKRSRDTKTPFKSDRNPALTVIPEIIPAVDPFSTPAENKLSRLQNWMTLKPGMHET
ncbi:mucin-17-like [Brassica napus]|uniref:mucin-17-like n=1 Tax=Brassica napus TaxID=3708 RepID=UPI00207915CC|nr:mucin-17-like [Brassica napus]